MALQEIPKTSPLNLLAEMPSCGIDASMCTSDGKRRPEQAFGEFVFNFAYGSNIYPPATLLARGKVKFESFELARLRGWRLAFTFRALPPVEPSFGSIEPLDCVDGCCEDGQHACSKTNSHFGVHGKDGCIYGALIKLRREEYHKLWLSEGGALSPTQYDEVVVRCELMDGRVIEALAFRTGAFKYVREDLVPSARYRAIICSGARQLGVPLDYQAALERIPKLPPLPAALLALADPAVRLIFRVETMNSSRLKLARLALTKALILYGMTVHNQRVALLRIASHAAAHHNTVDSSDTSMSRASSLPALVSNVLSAIQLIPLCVTAKLISAGLSFSLSISWIL